jgi:hypothetical protein
MRSLHQMVCGRRVDARGLSINDVPRANNSGGAAS